MSGGKKISFDKLHKVKTFNGQSDDESDPLLGGGKGPPKDTFKLTYIIFYLHGIGHLLPWNFFITATDYFSDAFTCPTNTTSHCHDFSNEFENYFSIAAMLPIVVMAAVNIWLQSVVHYKYRILAALLVTLLMFIITLAFVAVNTKSWVNGFFSLTILTVVVMNVFSAIFQSSTFGFAGVFPAQYTSSVLSGQAMAGIFAAVALIISKAVVSGDSTKSTYVYFAVAVIVILICLLTFLLMMRLPFVHYYLDQTSVRQQVEKQKEAVKASVNVKRVDTSPSYIKIFFKIFWHALSVFLVFAVTLSLFPAVLSQIESTIPVAQRNSWTQGYFSALVCFLLFNTSDYTGRLITHWIMVGNNRFVLFSLSLLRVLFVPLFLLCNVTIAGRHMVVIFDNDAWPIVFCTLFGLTNGYLGSVAMVTAPQLVRPDERETASTIMAFFLSFGLLAGSLISFLWTHAVLKIAIGHYHPM